MKLKDAMAEFLQRHGEVTVDIFPAVLADAWSIPGSPFRSSEPIDEVITPAAIVRVLEENPNTFTLVEVSQGLPRLVVLRQGQGSTI